MRYKKYLAGYAVFVGGIVASILVGLLSDSGYYSELGLEGVILISILGGLLPYIVGIISLSLISLIVSGIDFTYPHSQFFLWAFFTGFLSGISDFEVIKIMPFMHPQLNGIIVFPVIASVIYVLIRKMRIKN